MLIVVFAYFVTPIIVDGIDNAMKMVASQYGTILVSMVIFIAVLYIARVYTVLWIHASTRDYARILYAGLVASVFVLMINNLMVHFNYTSYGPRQTICAVFIILVFMLFSRMLTYALYSVYRERQHMVADVKRQRLLIVGAGSAAMILLKDLAGNNNLNYDVVGFIDDDKTKQYAIIYGVKVLGNRHDIQRICKEKSVDEILLAIPSAGVSDRREILEICNETGCKIKILPSIDQVISGTDIRNHVRDVQIEDLLAREPIKLDNTEISDYIEGKTILVTGGGGSIGSELCRQIMRYNPEKLVVLDIYENNAYDLQMELNKEYGTEKIDVIIASVRDKDRLKKVFLKYNPYIVFHAAAHKHVPLMEANPSEAIKNNVFGTLNAVQCADECGVKRFVLISTDKAVNPTNIMGATKRVCEMIVQCAQANSKTEFVAVRFGNVLGSNGSVIPLFKKQIESGGPVTVTHKEITRFFMTIPEATQLVLQAASYAKGGEIFVLDMGEPVRIYDLAKNLIRLSGYKPNVDMKIEVCGLRPGEKLYEELLMEEEGLENTEHDKIFIGKPIDIEKDKLFSMLADLKEAAEKDDIEAIKCSVEKVVPTYIRQQ
ncbi:MAG: polysaccharide biosynthesis protein [Clostridia bacterium]|nr:polysaccharide biosynthesis protein [Clostridia bacterium]